MLIGKYTKMNDKYFEPRTDTGMKDADDQPLFIGDEVTLCGNPGMVFNDAAGPCVIIETDGHPEMWRLDIIHDKLKLVPRSATELSVLEFIRERFPVDCDWTGKNSYYFAVILNNKFKNSQIVLDTNTEKYMIYLSNQYYDYNGRIKDTSGMRLVIFDDENNKSVAQVTTASKEFQGKFGEMTKTEQAKQLGLQIAELAKSKGIESVVFDRGGYIYHGRVQALAEGAREGGLKF